MRVLVTGGAGFIGSHITDALLAANHEPYIVDDFSTGSEDNIPSGVNWTKVDICDQAGIAKVFDEFQPEAVCHQAAQMSVSRSVREPSFDAQVNIMGILNLLENSVRVGVKRFVFASSGGVLYGNVETPSPETTPANPISPYGISKWVSEAYLRFFAREHGLKSVALRYSNVYGPRQNPHGEAGVVAIFSQRMLRGESVLINGDGKYIRDYVYAKDVARANFLALTEEIPGDHFAVNIGTGRPFDVNQLSEQIRLESEKVLTQHELSNTIPDAEYGPERAGDLRSNLVDASLIKQTWGWQPETTVEQGLQETVEWFFQQQSTT